MTDQHPVTPPPKLVQQWLDEWMTNVLPGTAPQYIATQAANWGADQELEACCEWFVRDWTDIETVDKLRAARRPKPQSLAEEALDQLSSIQIDLTRYGMGISVETIRRALERLQELEGQGDG